MKVHLNQIPAEGQHLEGSENSQILDLHEADIQPVGDVHYALDVGLSEGGLFATGEIGVDLELECVKCLERFRYPLRVPEFACQVELTGRETVDLTEPMREDIVLALPPHPHCDWNGERVCPGIFVRPKSETASDSSAVSGSPEDARKVWGALDQLKLK
jgi:uncharacterized metal-binding protein YceD (DUF177 family)